MFRKIKSFFIGAFRKVKNIWNKIRGKKTMANYLLECEIVGGEIASYVDKFITVKPRTIIREFNGKELDNPLGILIEANDDKSPKWDFLKIQLEKNLTIKIKVKCCFACQLFSRSYSNLTLVLGKGDSQGAAFVVSDFKAQF